jgi:hypothetical protein
VVLIGLPKQENKEVLARFPFSAPSTSSAPESQLHLQHSGPA